MRAPLVQAASLLVRINVTPIIDVALVLVIILLVTAPILSVADMDIELPAAHTRGAEDDVRISISLDRDGLLAIDDQFIGIERLASELSTRLDGGNRLVVVRADQGTTHGQVRQVLTEVKASGARRVAVATTQAREKR